MTIEKSSDGPVQIVVGDGDVLFGETTAGNLARLWVAPLPRDWPFPLNEVVPAERASPPKDAAVVFYFLNRACLNGLITMMTHMRDRAFPEGDLSAPPSDDQDHGTGPSPDGPATGGADPLQPPL